MREEFIDYATIEVMPESTEQQPKEPKLQEETKKIVKKNAKLTPVKVIKKYHKLSKNLQRQNATISNLTVLKKELRWHQKKAKQLQKLILDLTKDLAIMTDSEDDAGNESSASETNVKMLDAGAATPDSN